MALLVALLAACLAVPAGVRAEAPRPVVRISILQLNDVYQTVPVDGGKRGGLARVATLKHQIEKQSPHTLFLLAGDTIFPSVASGVFRGEQIISAYNDLGLDYACFGNHEFDMGDDVLVARIRQSKFKWISSNILDRRTGKPFGDTLPYAIRTYAGVKVGIFGLCTTDTKSHSKPGPDVVFEDPIDTARKIVPELRRRGATVIVALTHLDMADDKRLAAAVPVDVIIGGHEHEVLTSLVGRTPIFKMGSDARNLGRIDLNVNGGTGALIGVDWEIIPVTPAIPEDPQVAAGIAVYEKRLSAEMDRPVGSTKVVLNGMAVPNRTGETNLGDFIVDAYREYHGSDVGLLNGGSIRPNQNFGPGPLTRRDVVTILPYENPVVKIELTGQVLRQALEHGLSRVHEGEFGGFPHVSGIRLRYDARRPVGSRLVEVLVNGKPLDDRASYSMSVVTYILNGGDGYTMLKNSKVLVKAENAEVEPVVIMNAIKKAGEIAPQVDGRVQRIDAPKP